MHLKSKHKGWKDPSNTEFEISRMEMAEALREIVKKEQQRLGEKVIFVVLGDRNSTPETASAKILSGELRLKDFLKKRCRLDKKNELECKNTPKHQRVLLPLFETRKKRNPRDYKGGSYRYKRKMTLIDEILIEPEDISLLTRPSGSLAIGFEGDFYRGSDHRLLWAQFQLD